MGSPEESAERELKGVNQRIHEVEQQLIFLREKRLMLVKLLEKNKEPLPVDSAVG